MVRALTYPVHSWSRATKPVTAHPASVLLVDDDSASRLMVRLTLERTRRFNVVGEAASGGEGVAKAQTLRPDFVVLDVDMPGMSGLEALPLIREAVADTKIVLYSDLVAYLSPAEAATLDADLLVAKGRDLSALADALRTILPGKEGTQPHPGSTEAPDFLRATI